MHKLKKIVAIFVAIMIGSSMVVGAQAQTQTSKNTYKYRCLSLQQHTSPPWRTISIFEIIGINARFLNIDKEKEEIEPKYGVDFTEIREKFPNKPFVKEVLTDEVEEFLNEKELETGIPGAVIIAQAIWEVGWNLSTPKGGGRDSYNLFNIKNCDGNYVTMAGSRWQCYSSYEDSIEAYIELITTQPRYEKAYKHLKNGGDFSTYYRLLGDAGYYEAPKDTYTKNCMSIINSNNLVDNNLPIV